MAVSRVTLSRNLPAAVSYVIKGKSHYNNNVTNGHRFVGITAVNGSSDPVLFTKENEWLLRHNPDVHKESVKCIRTIISFNPKQLKYNSSHDREIGLAIGKRVAKRKYGVRGVPTLIVEQCDNKNRILHLHLISLARDKYGKSVTHEATFKKTQPFTDEAVRHFGLTPLPSPKPSHVNQNIVLRKIKQRKSNPNSSYIYRTVNTIRKCIKNSTSANEFQSKLAKHHIRFHIFKLVKEPNQTHNYRYHYYNHSTPKGKYMKITKSLINYLYKNDHRMATSSNLISHANQYLRMRKHLSYSVELPNGRTTTIRANKLGSDTDFGHLDHILGHNVQAQRQFHLTYKHTKPFKLIQNTYGYKGHTDRYPGTQVYLPFAAPVPNSRVKKFIKKKTGFPEPELVPRKVPKPKKPNISPTRALNSLMNSMEAAIKKAQNQAQFQAMIADSLRMYSKKKQKQAILMSQYQITKDAAVQRNDEIKQEIDGMRSTDIQTQRELQAERANREAEIRAARENDDGPTFNGPTLF